VTGKERMTRILAHQPVDRIGVYEHFWDDTQKAWAEQGRLRTDENPSDHFGWDIEEAWPFTMTADLDFVPQVIEETAETRLVRDGNGALLRRHKLHDATPEHVDFMVKERAAWEERIKPLLKPERRRIDFGAYRKAKRHAAEKDLFFLWSGVNVFEIMKDVAGHEHMLVGMALDPDWIRDMADTYARLTVQLQEILFAEEGYPDGIWYYEDMGFKQRPFMSPAMYRDIVQPAHARTFGYAHEHGMPVVVHSCGFVEPLLPGMIESGIDCLQVIEVKAGMDLLKIHREHGKRIALMGGIDVRTLYTNDRAVIDRELEAKIPLVKEGFGYVLHSDHSIPVTVAYDTYRYFIDKGLSLGAY
jgi:uroporphyrinogen decarboxylase